MAKILIVEDDPLIARLYEKIFTFEKYEVVMAEDGEDGLMMVKKEKPDLVLLDVMMPRMNGLETLDKLKADDETKEVPVVMLTNLAGQKDAETALAKGATKYIIKSQHEPKEIAGIVKDVLSNYPHDETLPAS